MDYKYKIKTDVQPKQFKELIGEQTNDKLQQLQISVERIKELIELRKHRVKQLDGAASAASEYLRSKLQEIPDADQNRLFVCMGIEHTIKTIDEQIAEHTKTVIQLLNP